VFLIVMSLDGTRLSARAVMVPAVNAIAKAARR